jgi:hypothetical protein
MLENNSPTPQPIQNQACCPPKCHGWLMVLGIVLLLAVAIGGYWLGTQKSIPVAKSSQSTSLPTKAVVATPPVDLTVSPTDNFSKRLFDLEEKFYNQSYPIEMTTIGDNDLIGIRCTPIYINTSTEVDKDVFFDQSSPAPTKLTDNQLSLFINKAQSDFLVKGERIEEAFRCETERGFQIFSYQISGGGGVMENSNYWYRVTLDSDFKLLAKIVNDGIPYRVCRRLLQLGKDSLYVECGGGDGGYSGGEIFKIDVNDKTYQRIIKCQSVTDIEGTTNEGAGKTKVSCQ